MRKDVENDSKTVGPAAGDLASNIGAASGIAAGVCTVAVDVGNTAVKLAVRQKSSGSGDQEYTIVDSAIAIDTLCWPTDAINWVLDRLGCQNTLWRISSVHRRAAEKLIESIDGLHANGDQAVVQLVRYQDVPMQVAVDVPDRLGIDRLLSAYAATCLPQTDHTADGLVVIDAGSAVTVDWVSAKGVFSGGAILPGLGLQAKALAMGTDALPQIDWTSVREPNLPATNTHDAIYGGILIGVAAAIDALVLRYFGADAQITAKNVVLTGGDSATLSRHLRCHHQCHSHLVCRGLLELNDSKLLGSAAS